MSRTPAVMIFVLVLVASGCGRGPRVAPPVSAATAPAPEDASPAPEPSGPGRPPVDDSALQELGQASWYGDPYHGRRAASGEVFDKNKLTAAHRTLPFDTWVRVENQDNGRTVDVRINDRGPFVAGRIIDLSEAAAREIDMIRAGVAPVRVTVLQAAEDSSRRRAPTDAAPSDVFYVVQLGAFERAENARALAARLEPRYTGIYVEPPPGGSRLWRVLIGRAVLPDAELVQSRLSSQDGIEAIVVEIAN